jgi:hypothetical protein
MRANGSAHPSQQAHDENHYEPICFWGKARSGEKNTQ